MVLESSSSPLVAIIALDVSIKNLVTTSIVHIYTYDKPIIKMIYHVVNVTSTEVELTSINHHALTTSPRLLSSQTPFMQSKESLTHLFIPFKFNQWPF